MSPIPHDSAPLKEEAKPNSKTSLSFNKGAWTQDEDQKLAEVIAVHGAKRWKSIAAKAGLNRCGKSCRLRWLNYLRPNIKRGNISDQEEDLILRLHKLLGNRWSLIAGRLPGRTDNEIKNYWNSHLSKKLKQKEKEKEGIDSSTREGTVCLKKNRRAEEGILDTKQVINSADEEEGEKTQINFNVDDFFDFSNEGALTLDWVSSFIEYDYTRA